MAAFKKYGARDYRTGPKGKSHSREEMELSFVTTGAERAMPKKPPGTPKTKKTKRLY